MGLKEKLTWVTVNTTENACVYQNETHRPLGRIQAAGLWDPQRQPEDDTGVRHRGIT